MAELSSSELNLHSFRFIFVLIIFAFVSRKFMGMKATEMEEFSTATYVVESWKFMNSGNVSQYDRTVLVLTRCSSSENTNATSLPAEKVCREFGVRVEWANCDPIMNEVEGRETGIMLRWIIANYNRLLSGEISTVIWHHAHETSWHQVFNQTLSLALRRLFNAPSYLYGNTFGDIYPNFIEHKMSFIRGKWDFWYYRGWMLSFLEQLVEGTQMAHFNRTNRYNVFRTCQNSAFFISSNLITQYPVSDYQRFLNNTVNFVRKMTPRFRTYSANYLVSEIVERGWQVLFTNYSFTHYTVPMPNWGNQKVYRFVSSTVYEEVRPSRDHMFD